MARILLRRRDEHWLVLASPKQTSGFVEELRTYNLRGLFEVQVIGGENKCDPGKFRELIERPRSKTILAAPEEDWASYGSELVHARLHRITVAPLSSVFEGFWEKIPVEQLDHRWFLQSDGFWRRELSESSTHETARRFDRGVLLLLAWPFMLLTAIAVTLESEGPALYRQVRTVRRSEDFVIYKFRSMGSDAEKNGAQLALKENKRITRVGISSGGLV